MRRFGALAIALIGLVCLVQSVLLSSFPASLLMPQGLGGEHIARRWIALALMPSLAAVLLGIGLIWGRNRLAARWFEESPLDLPANGMVLLRVGLTLIGVWLSVLAIPQFISQLVALANANPALELGTTGLIMTYGSRMVSAAVQLVFGILLIVTARRVSARLWLGRNSRTESGSALPTCASCGTAYNPDDYEPGSDARCVQCREPLDLGGA